VQTLNNQKEYWDSVANTKTFTHPLDSILVDKYFQKDFEILDYGCGYGRLTNEFYSEGFLNIAGVDTSVELINRGKKLFPGLNLTHINDAQALNNFDAGFDAVLLFAVLTCIPLNAGQKDLISALSNRLKKGGVLYISDYYLQKNTIEVSRYTFAGGDQNNYGVFTLPEGATFRHHTKEWIEELLSGFEIIAEKTIPVKTMNGHVAEAFQIIAGKS
jgi:2-polyprenyl-3-methyl-5-hydroxy-6-metoxy-1,4-benzoquinol methylase